MKVNEARARAKQLNSLELIKRQENKLRQLRLEERETGRKYRAFLPEEFKEEFERRFLRRRDSQTDAKLRRFTRAHTLWRAVQKLIIHVKIEPSEWFCNQYQIYDYLYESNFSLSYNNKLLTVLNLWGFFICKKLDQPFLPVAKPRGYERQRLVDNYYQNRGDKKQGSGPLSPEALMTAQGKMKVKQFNWLFISVWLGLRPLEIDNLQSGDFWRVETLPTGTQILWVFLTKLLRGSQLTCQEVRTVLKDLGYELVRQRGSHEQWVKDGRTFTLAAHGKDAPHYILDALRKLSEEHHEKK